MTHISPDGARTVTNGTVYDKRKVFEIEAVAVLDEVQSVYGTGEVERTGRKITETRTYHIIATDETLAGTLFAKQYSSDRYRVTGVKALFVIDGEITTGYN